MIRFIRKILVYKLYMDYDRDMGHSLQIYMLCAAIHLISIISLAFTYHKELQLILHMNDMFHMHPTFNTFHYVMRVPRDPFWYDSCLYS